MQNIPKSDDLVKWGIMKWMRKTITNGEYPIKHSIKNGNK
jgi:hypothetical protein